MKSVKWIGKRYDSRRSRWRGAAAAHFHQKKEFLAATSPATSAALTIWKIDPLYSSAESREEDDLQRVPDRGITGELTEHTTDASLSSIEATLDVSSPSTVTRSATRI